MEASELISLVANGETDTIEFKVCFPDNAGDLAKEIAAMASSNGGLVLLGVNDDHQIVGMNDLESAEQRKAIRERIEGLCAQAIVPPVNVSVECVTCDARDVLVISVPSGSDDVHYVTGRPYIRSMSISRVATPQEVKEKILLADILKRLRQLEARPLRTGDVAAGITGQGELATMNRSDLFELIEKRRRRQIP